MKYLCLVYLEEEKLHAVPDKECLACGTARVRAENWLLPNRLSRLRLPPLFACAMARYRLPMAHLRKPKSSSRASIWWMRADLNEAIQVASKIPPARVGSIEVRPVRELNPNA